MSKLIKGLTWFVLLASLALLLAACDDPDSTTKVINDYVQTGPDPCAGQPLLNCELKEAGISGLMQSGLGKQVNLTQSKNGFEVNVQWIYADLNLVIVAYTVSRPDRLSFNYGYQGQGLSDEQGKPLAIIGGGGRASREGVMGGLDWYDAAPLVGGVKELKLNFDLPGLTADRFYFFYRQTVVAEGGGNNKPAQAGSGPPTPTAVPPPAGLPTPDWTSAAYPTSFHFDLTVPVEPGREVALNQTANANGETVTLERMVLTPSQTRFYVGSLRDDWKGELSMEGWDSTTLPNNRKNTYNFSANQHRVGFDFINSLPNKKGEWNLTLTPMNLPRPGSTAPAPPGSPVTFRFNVG